ncbi:MAG: MMPL family transporter [Gammaproteobacteria bacterium]|nr:MMPL family transporter [Gammaproteobacteria bacterium]MCP5136991.1 MMPL family transporter [Gammaproteobacteria bacterium]
MSNNNQSEQGWTWSYARFVLRFRIPIMLFVLIGTIVAATQIPKLDVRNDPDTLLPPTNRYVATNLYGEHKFGMGNLMVWGMRIKGDGDIYQPWFINMVQELHNRVVELPYSNAQNFIDLASQKIKYMGVTEYGDLQFKRLIPVEGIDTKDPERAKDQLDYLRRGLEQNPAMGPMLLHFEDADGKKCDFLNHDGCTTKATFIIGDYSDEVKPIYLSWVRDVRAIVDDFEARYGDRVSFMTAGEPYFLAYMLLDLVNKWWLFVIAILIVMVVLWFEFRTARGAMFPLLGVGSTITMTIGAMGYTEFKLTTMMVLTPMLLLAIGIGHSVQITRRFLQERQHRPDDQQAAEYAIAATIVPATLSIVTDMVGFATLALVDISFYKDYAYFGVFGMMTLLLTTTTLIPLLFITFPQKEFQTESSGHWEHAVGRFLSRVINGPGKWVPITILIIAFGVSMHYTKVIEGVQAVMSGENAEFDIMPGVEKGINYSRAAFKEHSITIQDLEGLGKIMPGVISVNIPVRGIEDVKAPCGPENYENGKRLSYDCFDPDEDPIQGIFNDAEVLADLEAFEDWMRTHPYIGFTGSYVQFVKLVNMLLSSPAGEASDYRLFHIPTVAHMKDPENWEFYRDPGDEEFVPDPDQTVQLYNGLLQANTSAGDLDSFVDINTWNEGIVMGFVNTMDPVKTHVLVRDIQKYMRDHADSPGLKKVKLGLRNGDVATLTNGDHTEVFRVSGDPEVTDPAVGGFLGATEATREVAMSEWLKSPLTTAAAIFLISMLMFRSIAVPAILIFMLLVTLFGQYGMGGYFTSVQNWSGNLAFHTQVALSIAMGLGVDYGIYMFSRLREEMIAVGDWKTALDNTLSSTGSAVIVSVVVLLGSFIPLLSTELANTWALGIYITEALLIDVILALTILPLLVAWLKPRFVFVNKA